MMKNLVYIMLIIACFTGCKDTKKDEKELQGKILDFHEEVMANDEKAMINKMKFDTLIIKADSLKLNKPELIVIDSALASADNAMSDWMKDFNPDYAGKSHEDVMRYLTDQQVKVKQVDSMLVKATEASNQYLQKIKNK